MRATDSSYRRLGILLMLGGAVLFATKAIFVKLAYQYPVSSISLLALRMGFSLPFFLMIGWWRSRKAVDSKPISWRDWIGIITFGTGGYYLASYLDFLGLRYLTAGLERLILFVYPTLVLLIGWVVLNRKVHLRQWLATSVTYLGLVIAFWHTDWSVEAKFTTGVILIFSSAFTYATYVLYSGEVAPRVGSVRFNSIAMVAAGTAVLLHAFIANAPFVGLPNAVYAYGLAIAIIATVIPSYLIVEGIRRIGAGDAAILGAIGPVATIVLEYFVLGERLSVEQAIGGLLIIGGVILVGWNNRK